MSTPIQRLRYYDGEYLRSFDFEAEQDYHLQMRRRLNMGLHLPGIVKGLEIRSTSSSGIVNCSITPGMAVDAYGREIFVATEKSFDLEDDAFKSNRVSPPGDYSVWLRYRKTGSTAPSIGYSSCNQTGLTTRWQESFDIVLLVPGSPLEDVYNKARFTPDVNGALSEDATADHVAVYLGTIHINADSTFGIPPAKQQPPGDNSVEVDGGRPYIGVRAQLISPPVDAGSSLNILNLNTAQNPATSVEVDGTLFATKNLIVGGDFLVAPNSIKAAASGNAKITGDLFLNGTLYANQSQSGNFLSLDAYIAAAISKFVPDVRTGMVPIDIGSIPKGTTGPPAAASGSVTFSVSSALTKISSFAFSASLAKFELIDDDDAAKILTPSKAQGLSVEVSAKVAPASGPAPANPFNVTLYWTIGPTLANPADLSKIIFPVKSLVIAYTIVFYPDTSTPSPLP